MAFLQTKDFKKESGAGPYAGSSRADCIRFMIRDGVPFYKTSQGSGTKLYGVEYISDDDKKAGELVYVENSLTKAKKKSNWKRISASKIYKAPEMGGGSAGSGAGARATQIQECFQCFVNSYVFNVAGKAIDNLPTPAQLGKSAVTSYALTDASLKECLDEITDAWIQEKQYVRIANILYKAYGSKFTGKVYFHRGSKFMNKLYANKSAVQKLDRKSKKPQAPGSFSHDKWNPGDIWMSTLSKDSDPLKGCTSWGDLKYKVQEMADNGECLGISLKKLGKTGGSIKEFNREPLPDTKWYKWSWGKTGEFFKSIDIYVTVNGVQIQFRNFNTTTSWQGEIKGSAAAGGKIGGGNVDFYLREENLNKLYVNEKNFINKLKDDDTMADYLWEGYQRHNKNSSPMKPLMDRDTFMAELDEQSQGFKNSKAICIAFLDSVYSGQQKARNGLATAMFNYGSSATEQSSFFIKVA